MNMNMKRVLTKYLILILIYQVIVYVIEPYALKFYFSMSKNPGMGPESVEVFQSSLLVISSLMNFIFAIFILVDSKGKKIIDWLIIAITVFSPVTGVTFFFIWQIYKGMEKEREISGE